MLDLTAPYIQRGLIEVLLLAVLAGVLGTWIVLRRLPFYTHAIGTATFPGLVVAGPWGVPAQLTALVCAVGFGGVLGRAAAVVAGLGVRPGRRTRGRRARGVR